MKVIEAFFLLSRITTLGTPQLFEDLNILSSIFGNHACLDFTQILSKSVEFESVGSFELFDFSFEPILLEAINFGRLALLLFQKGSHRLRVIGVHDLCGFDISLR